MRATPDTSAAVVLLKEWLMKKATQVGLRWSKRTESVEVDETVRAKVMKDGRAECNHTRGEIKVPMRAESDLMLNLKHPKNYTMSSSLLNSKKSTTLKFKKDLEGAAAIGKEAGALDFFTVAKKVKPGEYKLTFKNDQQMMKFMDKYSGSILSHQHTRTHS